MTTSNSYLRVLKIEVIEAGSGGANAGRIDATASTAVTIQASIPIGYNRCSKSHYTVPAGKSAVFHEVHSSLPITGGAGNNEDALIHLEVRELNEVFQKRLSFYASSGETRVEPSSELVFPEKTDVKFVGIRIDSTDARLALNYSMLIVDDTVIT